MKSFAIPLFLFLAVNGAWATFPLPYFQLGLIPPSQNFIHHPPQAFGAQFFAYPQLRRNFLNVYQPLSYVQPQRYNFYEPPQVPRFPSYSEYFPSPENSHNSVVQYVYQQTPLNPVPSSSQEPMHNFEPVLEALNKVAEEPKPEEVQQLEEETDASKSGDVTATPVNSADKSKSEDVATSPMIPIDDSKSEEVTPNPTNSEPEAEPTKLTEPMPKEEAEDIAAKSTEDHEDDATPLTEETPTESPA